MANIKYYYDNESCQYLKVRKSAKQTTWQLLKNLSLCLIFSLILIKAKFTYLGSHKTILLEADNTLLKKQFLQLNESINQIEEEIKGHECQDNFCRDVLNSPHLPKTMRMAGRGGINLYKELEELDRDKIIFKTTKVIDKLKDKINIQYKSYEQIVNLEKIRQQKLACTPCIQPINKSDLKRVSDTFRFRRRHPVLGTPCMHNGHDFVVQKKKPVFATADGVVVKSYYSYSGGHWVEIDHGHGKRTRYMHLDTRLVSKGQRVKRGAIIGLAGATGYRTSGTHVHYEVLDNGKNVDPRLYLFDSKLNQYQYEKIKKTSLHKLSKER